MISILTREEKRARYNNRQGRKAARRGQPSVNVKRRRKAKTLRRKGGESDRIKARRDSSAPYRPLQAEPGTLPPESNLLTGLFAALLRVRRRR